MKTNFNYVKNSALNMLLLVMLHIVMNRRLGGDLEVGIHE